jgi:hypothetical protein
MMMTKQEQAKYLEKKPIAVYPMTNWGGIEIMDILYDVDDKVVYRFNFGEPQECHVAKIRGSHSSFKTIAGYSIRLDECMRV